MTAGGTKAKDLFLEALELEPAEREDFLASACQGDEVLRARVDELLGAHDDSEALDGWLGKGIDVDPLGGAGDGKPIGAIGDYELIEKIASGAMGTVYRARQMSLDRIVALKVLRVGRFATEEEVRRFRAEAEGAARLDHPNIVPIYEVGEAERRNFFSMKLIAGPGLDAIVDSFRHDPRRTAGLVATVARAVHHAHQHGLLHRDVKPSNILVDAEGTPHVADFGIAKRLGDDVFDTNPGVIAGTPAYMAPEQLTAEDEVTVRTDVYALGCVLYELLSGQAPFAGRSIADVFHDVLEKEPAPVDTRNPEVPRDLAIICHKCLAKDPRRRYGSTLALAEDLERWLDHIPIRARPTSLLERAGLYWRRKPVQASLAMTVALLILTFAIGATATSFVLREYLNRAIGAETTANERLRTALLAQARANLRGDRPGRRHESLGLLEQAAQIEPGADLRDEAIKAMTVTDLSQLFAWEHEPGEGTVGWDFTRNRFLLAHLDGSLSLRTFDDEVIAELPPLVDGRAWCARFSPDGRRAVVKYHGQETTTDAWVAVWDLERSEVVFRIERSLPNHCMWFHPDGKTFVLGSSDEKIALIDMEALEAREWFEAEAHPNGVRFRPDGSEIALSLSKPKVIEIRGYPDGEVRRRLELESAPMSLDWTPDGQRLVVGNEDSFAYVLDAETGEELDRLEGHQAEIVVTHCTDADLVITSSWDETTRLWDLKTARTLITATDTARNVSRDGKLLGFTNRGRAGVWTVEHDDLLRTFHGHWIKGPRWVAVSPSGRWMASGGDDETLLWSLEENRQLGSLETGLIGGLAFSPERDLLYASTQSGLTTYDLDASPEDPLAVEPRLILPEVTLRFGFDESETVFVAGIGKNIEIIDLKHPERNKILGAVSGTNRLFMSPNGEYAAAGSWRGRGVRIWNVESGELEAELLMDYNETTVSFSPDGDRMLTGNPDAYSCWRVGTWELEYTVPRNMQPTNLPGTIEFDRTGSLVAIAPATRVLWLLDPRTGELLMTLDAAESFPFTRMAFLPGNRGIATATSGLRVLLWDLDGMITELRERGLDHGLEAWPEVEAPAGVTR